MGDMWLFGAMLLSSTIGYRMATRQGLSGVTGVAVSLVLCTVLGTDLWDRLLHWYATRTASDLLAHAGIAVVAASTLFILEKLKLYAFVKLLGLMVPISFTSVRAPEIAMSGYEVPSTSQRVELVTDVGGDGRRIRKDLESGSDTLLGYVAQAFSEVKRAGREFQKLARVSTDTLLYRSLEDGKLVRSSVVVPEGTWVVAEEEVVDQSGQRWLKVSMRTRTGSQEGFIPLTKVASGEEPQLNDE